jgi:uncharacterized protein with GYD domain
MCRFSHQISFTSSAWHALMEDPIDPFAAVRTPIESLGGTLVSAFFTGDSYDVLAITEFPDAISPDDISIAFYADGTVATIHSSLLLTASQADEAKRKAGAHSYRLVPRAHTLAATAS